MTHVYHDTSDRDTILHDGCPECEARAKDIHGLHHLDPVRINGLWRKMQALEFGGAPTLRVNRTEAQACRVLYDIAVLLEHMTGENMKFARPMLRFEPSYVPEEESQ